MLKIGIKYCGGCNPDYDRVALVKVVQKALQGRVKFTPSLEENFDLVLVMQGCKTACADLKPFRGKEICQITGPEDSGPFIREMDSRSLAV